MTATIVNFAETLNARRVAGVVAERAQAQAAVAHRTMPAYCDPSNEVRGSKFEATKELGLAEITKRIRADLKAAQKAGNLDARLKISVRKRSYSALSVHVELPEGFSVMNTKAAGWVKQFGEYRDVPMHWQDQQSEGLRQARETIQSAVAAYNRDNSDSMVDYFDTRFYSDVVFDNYHELRSADIAAAPSDIWGE